MAKKADHKRVSPLFMKAELRDYLGPKRRQSVSELSEWDSNDLLQRTPEAIAAELLERYGVQCPVLDVDGAQQEEVIERSVSLGPEFQAFDVRRTHKVFRLTIPFAGDPELFRLRPALSDNQPPIAHLDTVQCTLTVEYTQIAQDVPNPDLIETAFREEIRRVNLYLDRLRTGVDEHNAQVGATEPIVRRVAVIRADRDVQNKIGFRQRPDAESYKPPAKRSAVHIRTKVTRSHQTEYVIDDDDYERALDVLEHARNALERTPELAATFGEEQIRDLLLIFLNAIFEGSAAGEVFNKDGKTDILIKELNKNVFIAECKIWNGPRTIEHALEQLLDRYMTWRDVKVSLLLFIRGGDVTSISRRAAEVIENHPRYLRTSNAGSPGERSDFVFHAQEDPAQEVRLAFLPFVLPRGSAVQRA